MAQTYLYSYGAGPYGASLTRRDRAYIESQNQFSKVHPEVRRRLFAIADAVIAAGSDYGFGGGWRSSAQQLALYLSRYTKVSGPQTGASYWDGKPNYTSYAGWYVHTSGAPSTPPGRSYHESTTSGGTGWALAVDMVGDHTIANKLSSAYGLKDLSSVNGEPWHYQPIEVPTARRNYTNEAESLLPFPIPGTPVPPIIPPEIDMSKYIAHNAVRILETRPGNIGYNAAVAPGKLSAGSITKVKPHSLTSPGSYLVLNLTGFNAEANGFVTVWDGAGGTPVASQINLAPNDASPKNGFTIVPQGADGTFSVYTLSTTDLIIDQVGFIQP